MKKLTPFLLGFFAQTMTVHARLAWSINWEKTFNSAVEKKTTPSLGLWASLYENFIFLLYLIGLVILIFIALWFTIKLIRLGFELYYSKNLRYLRVTLPRSDSKLDKEHETKKDFKEKIGMMSIFYKASHKLSETWFKDTVINTLFNHAKISMEMVYNNGQVSFYVVTYEKYVNLVSQHITSIYTDAEVMVVDPKKDYVDLTTPGYKMRCASLGKEHDYVFPIKTYKYLEDDPLNNFSNVFWGLGKEDKAIFQLVMKPVSSAWNKKAKKAAGLVAKGKYKKAHRIPFIDIFWNPLVAMVDGPEDMVQWSGAPGASEGDSYKIFNQAETESQKIMGESAAQPCFRTSIRLIVSTKNDQESLTGLQSLVAASSIYTDEYNNSLDNPQFWEDGLRFIFWPMRYFAYKNKLVWFFQSKPVFSTDELSTLYHFPDINYNKSPIINWLGYKKLPVPQNLKFPKDATILEDIIETNGDKQSVKTHRKLWGFPVYKDAVLMGWNEYRNKKTPVYFNRKDRGRHHYVIGKSGWGKSVFLGYLARQDVWNGDGLCVIDPHGDFVEDVLAYIPKERAGDVIVFDPSDDQRPMGLNILEVISQDPDTRKREMDRAALDATEIFIKIFGDEIFGPRIQHYFRNGALTLMEDELDGGTLIDVPRLFVDDAFMKYKSSKIKNPVVKSFWQYEYANTGDREKQEMIPYFSAKFGPFITNTTIRNIIGQPKSAFNIRDIMDNRKILLVNLSKGKIGALNAQLLGLVFVSKVNMAAMSRADIPEPERKDFFMYVDEFQNFATDTFGEILSEARKYHLSLIMAHQYIAQIGWSGDKQGKSGKPAIKDAVFWNAWTIMSFKVGAEDAEYLEKEYAPLLSQQDIIGIANYTAYCKLNIDNATSRPFDLKTIWDESYKNKKAAEIIREYSRKKYGRKKKYVDLEIEARLGIMPETLENGNGSVTPPPPAGELVT
jgi:Type IV secretory system Conjugative DNA transfer